MIKLIFINSFVQQLKNMSSEPKKYGRARKWFWEIEIPLYLFSFKLPTPEHQHPSK